MLRWSPRYRDRQWGRAGSFLVVGPAPRPRANRWKDPQVYTERQVKAYPIFESELESLSFLNTMTLVFFSVGSATISFAVGIWTNATFAEKMTPEGVVASIYGAPVLLVAAAICYGLGGLALYSRRQQWSKIKTESVARTEPSPDEVACGMLDACQRYPSSLFLRALRR